MIQIDTFMGFMGLSTGYQHLNGMNDPGGWGGAPLGYVYMSALVTQISKGIYSYGYTTMLNMW